MYGLAWECRKFRSGDQHKAAEDMLIDIGQVLYHVAKLKMIRKHLERVFWAWWGQKKISYP
jgi:hypothetical protein